MVLINYTDAPSGAGKTFDIQEKVYSLWEKGKTVIVAQPTKRLIEQTVKSMRKRYPEIDIRSVHSDNTDEVTKRIMDYGTFPDAKPPLFITYAAFERIPFFLNRNEIHLVIDEVPQVHEIYDENLKAHHNVITEYLTREPKTNSRYSQLMVVNKAAVRAIAKNENQDEVNKIFQPLANRLLSDHWATYVLSSTYDNLVRGTGVHKRLTTFSLLDPSIFQGFASVTIAGAWFKESLLFLLWSNRGVKFVEDQRSKLRYKTHPNGDLLTILYVIEQDWSKALRDKFDGKILGAMVSAISARFGNTPFLWNANKDVSEDLFPSCSHSCRLLHSPHGLNEYQDYDNVVVLSAQNLTPAHGKFLQEVGGLDREDICTATHRQQVYQALFRGSARDPLNLNPKCFFVPDRGTAEWLQSKVPGSRLEKIGLDLGDLKISDRPAQPSKYSSDAEKQKAYRERKKQKEAEAVLNCFNQKNPIEMELCNADKDDDREMCYVKAIYDSPEVTTFRGSILSSITSTRVLSEVCTDTIDEFEWNLRRVYKDKLLHKEDNLLLCPSKFLKTPEADKPRGLDNVEFVNGIWLDKDKNGIGPKQFADLFPTLRMTIYSTFSSTKKCVRYRVYIPTSRGMTTDEYKAVVKGIIENVEEVGYHDKDDKSNRNEKVHGFDKSKYHAVSLFYLPCQPADPSGRYFKNFKGGNRKSLIPSEWIREERPEPVPFIQTPEDWHGSGDQGLIEAARNDYRSASPGTGNDEFLKLALKSRSAGCSLQDIAAILQGEAVFARHPEERRKQIPSIISWLESH